MSNEWTAFSRNWNGSLRTWPAAAINASWGTPTAALDSESILSLICSQTGYVRVHVGLNPFSTNQIGRWRASGGQPTEQVVSFQAGDSAIGQHVIGLPPTVNQLMFQFTSGDSMPIKLNGHSILRLIEWSSSKAKAHEVRYEEPHMMMMTLFEAFLDERFDWDGTESTLLDMITTEDGELLYVGFNQIKGIEGGSRMGPDEVIGLFSKSLKLSLRDEYLSELLKTVYSTGVSHFQMPNSTTFKTAPISVGHDPYGNSALYFGFEPEDEVK